jgi:hypothetical protein
MTASFLKNLKKLKLALISGRALTYIKKYPFAGTLYCLLNSNQCAPHRFGSEAGERAARRARHTNLTGEATAIGG